MILNIGMSSLLFVVALAPYFELQYTTINYTNSKRQKTKEDQFGQDV